MFGARMIYFHSSQFKFKRTIESQMISIQEQVEQAVGDMSRLRNTDTVKTKNIAMTGKGK